MKKCDMKRLVDFEMSLNDELNDFEAYHSLVCQMDGRDCYDW